MQNAAARLVVKFRKSQSVRDVLKNYTSLELKKIFFPNIIISQFLNVYIWPPKNEQH